MKTYIRKAVLLCGYLFLIVLISGFSLEKLFDGKEIFLVAVGCILLTIPYIVEKEYKQEWLEIAGNNSMISSYLVVLVLIFGKIGQIQAGETMMSEILLCLRPVMYGFVMMVLLKRPEITSKRDDAWKNLEKEVLKEEEKEVFQKNQNENGQMEKNEIEVVDLTEREKEIVRLVIAGLSNREIGEQLYIAESTVKKHMSHIFEKLEVKNREQLKQKFR